MIGGLTEERHAPHHPFRPEVGSKFLTAEEALAKPADFLIDELGDRLARGPVKFRLVA